jgi:hypothetical protein
LGGNIGLRHRRRQYRAWQQSFRWVAKATLTGAAQLGYYVSGGMTIVRASTGADATSELEISSPVRRC